MPYSFKQCQKFGAMARRGEKVPADWEKHCKGVKKPSKKKKTKKGKKK
jgi:hypothetical protein